MGGRGLGAEWDDVSAVGGGGKGKKVGRWEEGGTVGEWESGRMKSGRVGMNRVGE